MDRAPRLRVISRSGTGLDNIAIHDATQRGIAVCNVPDGPTISTAEHALALLLATAKRLKQSEHALRESRADYFNEYQELELHGLTLGIVGLGQIGSRMARFGLALEMRVVAYDPLLDVDRLAALGVGREQTLDALLRVSDVVSLHAPLTASTYRLIDSERLAQMKPGAILINTARGSLIDEEALVDALE
jgi:D-3-phosphoglycerate dehydrogenase